MPPEQLQRTIDRLEFSLANLSQRLDDYGSEGVNQEGRSVFGGGGNIVTSSGALRVEVEESVSTRFLGPAVGNVVGGTINPIAPYLALGGIIATGLGDELVEVGTRFAGSIVRHLIDSSDDIASALAVGLVRETRATIGVLLEEGTVGQTRDLFNTVTTPLGLSFSGPGGEGYPVLGGLVQRVLPPVEGFIERNFPQVDQFINRTRGDVDRVIRDTRPRVDSVIEDTRPRVDRVLDTVIPQAEAIIEAPQVDSFIDRSRSFFNRQFERVSDFVVPPAESGELRDYSQASELIRSHEGLRLDPYYDPAGLPTVGYGQLLSNEPYADLSQFDSITEDQAVEFLNQRLDRIDALLDDLVEVPIDNNQRNALASFVYNVGEGNFRSSTLLRELNTGNYEGAAEQFPSWIYGGGRQLPGLVNRREDERNLFQRAVSGIGDFITPPAQSSERQDAILRGLERGREARGDRPPPDPTPQGVIEELRRTNPQLAEQILNGPAGHYFRGEGLIPDYNLRERGEGLFNRALDFITPPAESSERQDAILRGLERGREGRGDRPPPDPTPQGVIEELRRTNPQLAEEILNGPAGHYFRGEGLVPDYNLRERGGDFLNRQFQRVNDFITPPAGAVNIPGAARRLVNRVPRSATVGSGSGVDRSSGAFAGIASLTGLTAFGGGPEEAQAFDLPSTARISQVFEGTAARTPQVAQDTLRQARQLTGDAYRQSVDTLFSLGPQSEINAGARYISYFSPGTLADTVLSTRQTAGTLRGISTAFPQTSVVTDPLVGTLDTIEDSTLTAISELPFGERIREQAIIAEGSIDGLGSAANRMGNALANTFVGFVTQTDDWTQRLAAIPRLLQDIIIELTILRPATNFLSDLFSATAGRVTGNLGGGGGSEVVINQTINDQDTQASAQYTDASVAAAEENALRGRNRVTSPHYTGGT